MARKTLEERKEMAKRLEALKPRVRRHSAFGDDHYKALDAMRNVIENTLDNDDIAEEYGDDSDVESAALDALAWLDGENDTDLASEGEWPMK